MRFLLDRSPLLLILLSSVALAPLAGANPADPIGVGSLYERDDTDDVSLPPISLEGVLEGPLLPDLKPSLIVVGGLPPRATAASGRATLFAFQFRSPPLP